MNPFFFGSSESMRALERRVDSIALSNLPVLIEGESGTGKETLAEHLHQLSRAKGKFVRLNCGCTDEKVLGDDHLGAGRPRGALHETLYLKHLSKLSPKLQQQLLGAIQAGLGSDAAGDANASTLRLVSTTVEPLEPLVARGDFLPDLYFQLAVYRLSLPPLRERSKDLRELFLSMMARFLPGRSDPAPAPPPRLWRAFLGYQWPGNLRELQNFARTYAVSHDPLQIIGEIERRSKSLDANAAADTVSLREQVRRASKQLESEIILKALEHHRWNRRRTAQTLKISYRALLYKMKECKLREEFAGGSD